MLITDLNSGNTMKVHVFDIDDVEAARDRGIDYTYWFGGPVSVNLGSAGMAYLTQSATPCQEPTSSPPRSPWLNPLRRCRR
jgi:hypothetical protein